MEIPVTLVAGFLGSGKTTLVNRVLKESHGVRCAVVVNEFGSLGIDGDLVVSRAAEGSAVVELANGCICCEIQEDLRTTLTDLVAARGASGGGGSRWNPARWLRRSGGGIDRILVEASGAASPGPAVQTFLVDGELSKSVVLDGVVTLVHAEHIRSQLERTVEAADQIAYADRIVVNHSDRVSDEELEGVTSELGGLNPLARLRTTERAEVPLKWLFGGLDRSASADQWTRLGAAAEAAAAAGAPVHTPGLGSVTLTAEVPVDRDAMLMWLEFLSRRRTHELMRAKGILAVGSAAHPTRLVVQGVYRWLEASDEPGEAPATSRLVLIGRDLDVDEIHRGWAAIGGLRD